MKTVQGKILARIRRKGRGKVFTSKDFLDLAGREAVDQALSRLVKAGTLDRLGRGLFYYARVSPRLQIRLRPDPDEVAAALGRRTGTRVVPSGAVAANRLGLTTQVPAKPVYLTSGRSRRVRAADTVFVIHHVAPKEFPLGSPTSALVFQALEHMGREMVDAQMIARLRRNLTPRDRRTLMRNARYATDWIADVARQVAIDDPVEEVLHG